MRASASAIGWSGPMVSGVVLATAPAEQVSWPAHLGIAEWTPHLERLSRQLVLRDAVFDLQQLVQRIARGVHRVLALRGVEHEEQTIHRGGRRLSDALHAERHARSSDESGVSSGPAVTRVEPRQ